MKYVISIILANGKEVKAVRPMWADVIEFIDLHPTWKRIVITKRDDL